MTKAHSLHRILIAAMLFAGSSALAGSFQEAIKAGDIERVRLEIAQGADVNQAEIVLGLPLVIAAQGNHIAIAELLVAHGADVNGMDVASGLIPTLGTLYFEQRLSCSGWLAI